MQYHVGKKYMQFQVIVMYFLFRCHYYNENWWNKISLKYRIIRHCWNEWYILNETWISTNISLIRIELKFWWWASSISIPVDNCINFICLIGQIATNYSLYYILFFIGLDNEIKMWVSKWYYHYSYIKLKSNRANGNY